MKPRKRFIWIGIIVIGVASLGSFSYFAIMRHDRVESFTELTTLDSGESVALKKLLSDLHGEVPFYYDWVQRRRKVSQAVLPKRWLLKVRQVCFETEVRRWDAERELSHMGKNAWPALADLVDALEHRNPRVGMAAGNALAGMRADEAPDWGRLANRLQGATRPAHVFHRLLTGRDRGGTRYGVAERRFALVGLAASGAASAFGLPDVIEVLRSDEDPELRSLAVDVVGKLEAQREHSRPLLKEILQNKEEWPEVSAAAALALARAAPNDPETRQLLRAASQDPRSKVRLEAARALWSLKTAVGEVLPVLTALLNHKLASTRAGALNAISEMGSAARMSRLEVERLTLDESEAVRRAASAALKRIEQQ